jgi:hypothetical protein
LTIRFRIKVAVFESGEGCKERRRQWRLSRRVSGDRDLEERMICHRALQRASYKITKGIVAESYAFLAVTASKEAM